MTQERPREISALRFEERLSKKSQGVSAGLVMVAQDGSWKRQGHGHWLMTGSAAVSPRTRVTISVLKQSNP